MFDAAIAILAIYKMRETHQQVLDLLHNLIIFLECKTKMFRGAEFTWSK